MRTDSELLVYSLTNITMFAYPTTMGNRFLDFRNVVILHFCAMMDRLHRV